MMHPWPRLSPAVFIGFLSVATTLTAAPFSIAIGDAVSDGAPGPGAGRIDAHTEEDIYTFSASQGDAIFAENLGVSSEFQGYLRWELRTPSNGLVFSSYFDKNNEGRRTLPETGTYTLRVWVSASNPDYVGTYSFRLRPIPPDPTFTIELNETVTNGVPAPGAGNLEVPGAWDNYTFQGTNGQIVFFETLHAGAGFQGNLYLEVRHPSSNSFFAAYLTGGNHPARKVLTETGTYQLRVSARSTATNHTGTYSIRVRPVPPDQTFAIVPGQIVISNVPSAGAGSIEHPGEQDFYTFEGVAGQSVSFDAISEAPGFAGWLQWEAKSPGGVTLFNSYFDDSGRKTLAETGTYRIRVWVGSNNTGHLGNYSFKINALSGDVDIRVAKGDVISDGAPVDGAGRIDEPGGVDRYTFPGIAGQRVTFEQRDVAPQFEGYLFWQIIAPGGTNWFGAFFPGNRSETRTLPETGDYTVRVYANSIDAAHTGFYSFKILCPVDAATDNVATPPETTLSIPFNKFLCNDTLEIGDVPIVDATGLSSIAGGALAVGSTALLYTPPAGFSGIDEFTYRLRGQFGGEDTATVRVRVMPGVDAGASVVSFAREGNSSVAVCLLGMPDETYAIEHSTDLRSWTGVDVLTADETGSMTYSYAIEPGTSRFYRFRRQ